MPTTQEITDFYKANANNPDAIRQAMTQYGITAEQAAAATGAGADNFTFNNLGGKTYSTQQVKDFYANGGDDNKFAQELGITDPWQRREAILQARGVAGAGTMGGEGAFQTYFNRYKQYNPNGKFVNDFNGWLNDMPQQYKDAMKSGTYTGVAFSPSDSDVGGIYGPGTGHDSSFEQTRYGMGAHGTGDGWGAWTGAAGENKPGSSWGTGTGGTGGSGGAGGTGGSGGSGASGSWGSSYSVSSGAPQMNLASLQGPTNWNVDPATQTVQGQLQSVLATDSPLIQQARTRALQAQNANGRLNSTMAQSAADSAMYDAALQIATPDAATYANAANTNAATANTFSRDNNSFARQQELANFNVNANNWAAQQDYERQIARDKLLNEMGVTNSSTSTTATKEADAIKQIQNARAEFASKVASLSANTELDAQARLDAINVLKVNYNAIIKLAAERAGWTNSSDWIIQGDAAPSTVSATSGSSTSPSIAPINPYLSGGGGVGGAGGGD